LRGRGARPGKERERILEESLSLPRRSTVILLFGIGVTLRLALRVILEGDVASEERWRKGETSLP